MMFPYLGNLKKDTDELIYKTESHRHRKTIPWLPKGDGEGG